MAEGIKYFPLSCNDDERYDFIEAEFGLKGYAILVKLHKKIHRGLGYYCEWNDRVSKLFAKNSCCGVAPTLVQEVVKAAINEKIFDRTMYEKYGILTSLEIQKTFYNVAKRREEVFDIPEYVLLISHAPNSSQSVVASNSVENVSKNGQNVRNETTSRVEESRANKSRVEESKSPPLAALTPENRKILIDQYGKSAVDDYEKRFSDWRALKKAYNADAFKTISKWLQDDKPKRKYEGHSSFCAEDVEKATMDKYKQLGGKKDDDED